MIRSQDGRLRIVRRINSDNGVMSLIYFRLIIQPVLESTVRIASLGASGIDHLAG